MSKIYLGYLWEKAYLATLGLSSNTENIQNRIYSVYHSHLITLQHETKKEELKDFILEVNNTLIRGGNYTLDEAIDLIEKNNTGKSLSNEQAINIAKTIVNFYDFVSRRYPND